MKKKRCISKILFIDTEWFFKMQNVSQVFFKNFMDRFGTTYLKGYFHYKTITSQNVSFVAQVKNSFIF